MQTRRQVRLRLPHAGVALNREVLMAWFMAHYKDILLGLMVLDGYLIQIFPSQTIFAKIKDILMGLNK